MNTTSPGPNWNAPEVVRAIEALRADPRPVPPGDFATRCLARARPYLRVHPVRRAWWHSRSAFALAGGITIALVALVAWPRPAATSPRYLLLLLEPDQEWPARREGMGQAYRAWSAVLREEGNLDFGAKLADQPGVLLSQDTAGRISTAVPVDPVVSGAFVVEARDLQGAIALASRSPHFAHGGRVLVREVD